MGPHIVNIMVPHWDFGAPFELALWRGGEVAFGTAIMSASAKDSVKRRRVEQCFYSRTHYGKCHHGQARRVLRGAFLAFSTCISYRYRSLELFKWAYLYINFTAHLDPHAPRRMTRATSNRFSPRT